MNAGQTGAGQSVTDMGKSQMANFRAGGGQTTRAVDGRQIRDTQIAHRRQTVRESKKRTDAPTKAR